MRCRGTLEDEDEREPRFIQAHDPDFVPKPVYPEYIPLEDEHVLPAEEQPLPPVDSPTTESPRYVAELDPKEDPEDVGYGIKDIWIDPVEAVPALTPTTIEEVNTRVVELAELHETVKYYYPSHP
nr:hypothetical protein [Tanacetum cinerariifolium]